jgi:predicted DNA-binding transcriptional regulator AlpA
MTASPFMTCDEAAAFCHCSVDAFDAHVRPQLPPPKRVGRKVLFLRSDLDRWAEGDTGGEAARVRRRELVRAAPAAQATTRDLRELAEGLPLTARQRARLLGRWGEP